MKLNLGETYLVTVILCNYSVIRNELKFIKVTRKGYNFLDEKTNKCVFKNHFYQINKNSKHYKGENDFYIPFKHINIYKKK